MKQKKYVLGKKWEMLCDENDYSEIRKIYNNNNNIESSNREIAIFLWQRVIYHLIYDENSIGLVYRIGFLFRMIHLHRNSFLLMAD